MATPPAKEVLKQVRPLLSRNREEARRRVLSLFKQWCRQIEVMNTEYFLPLSFDEATKKIKSEFLKNKDITDVRVIDMLILKCENELYDIKNKIRFPCQFYYKVKLEEEKADPKNDFLKKFLAGSD